mmetsp:Transcript_30026/g.54312  ORF Transcript_30026/g.54312 Transcript_30026/m.54312 type:complete len:118 (+) Transcript_30026:687-1040(+)
MHSGCSAIGLFNDVEPPEFMHFLTELFPQALLVPSRDGRMPFQLARSKIFDEGIVSFAHSWKRNKTKSRSSFVLQSTKLASLSRYPKTLFENTFGDLPSCTSVMKTRQWRRVTSSQH